MTGPTDAAADIDGVRAVFEDAFARVYAGEVDSDDFNRLVLAARLAADEVRRAARLRALPAADRVHAVAGVHRGDAAATSRRSRGMLVSLFRAALRPRPRTTTTRAGAAGARDRAWRSST